MSRVPISVAFSRLVIPFVVHETFLRQDEEVRIRIRSNKNLLELLWTKQYFLFLFFLAQEKYLEKRNFSCARLNPSTTLVIRIWGHLGYYWESKTNLTTIWSKSLLKQSTHLVSMFARFTATSASIRNRSWAYRSTTPSPRFKAVPAVQLPPRTCWLSTICRKRVTTSLPLIKFLRLLRLVSSKSLKSKSSTW